MLALLRHGRIARESGAKDGRAGRDGISHHHPGHVGRRIDFEADAQHVAARECAFVLLFDVGDGFIDAVAGSERGFERDGGEALDREPRFARAFMPGLHCYGSGDRFTLGPRQIEHATLRLRGPGERLRRFGFALLFDGRARDARYFFAFKLGGEFVEREATPEVGGGGVPCALVLPRDEAADQTRHVFAPAGAIYDSGNQPCRVYVSAHHQPPPIVFALGREHHLGALHRETRAQHLFGAGEMFVALRDALHALQDREPVDHRVRGPELGLQGDRFEQLGRGFAGARQGFYRADLAHVEVFGGRPEVALDAAFDEGDQRAFHAFAGVVGDSVTGFVGHGQHVGSQRVAPA